MLLSAQPFIGMLIEANTLEVFSFKDLFSSRLLVP